MLKRPGSSEVWRVVLDNNTWLSSMILPLSVPGRLINALRPKALLLGSEETLAELHSVCLRAKFDRYLPLAERLEAFDRIKAYLEVVQEVEPVRACRDPKDDKFLALAISGGASTIVTGDEDLLTLDPFRQIEIIAPADCLKRLELP